jgi:DNA-binding NarL/FixJ family response regulator
LTAKSAREATAIIEAAPPLRCAIVDIGLPDGSGLDLLGPLREGYALLPILILTAYHEPELINRAQAHGVEYLVKPNFVAGLKAFAARVTANEAARAAGSVEHQVKEAVGAFAATHGLSARERDVLALAVAECSRSEIAERLGVTIHTVKTQSHSILVKSREPSLAQLARRLRQR